MAGSRLDRIRRALGGETTLEGAIDAMGREREGQVLERLADFTNQVVVIVEKLQDMVERFATDRYDELEQSAAELDRLESAADDTKESILDQVFMGGVFPMHRSDLARLTSSMDSIANLATGAADRISMRKFSLPPHVNAKLVELAQVDLEAVRTLRDAVLAMSNDLQEAIKLVSRVDKIESRADDVYAEIYQAMFDMDTDFRTFHQLKAIIDRLESITDRCNHVAERLRHMALEYLENG